MEYRNTQIPISKATKLVHLVLLLRCFCFRYFAATAAAAATIAALLALISLLCVCCALLLAWHSLAFCAICALYFFPLFGYSSYTDTQTRFTFPNWKLATHNPHETLKYFIFFISSVSSSISSFLNSTCNGRSITVFFVFGISINQLGINLEFLAVRKQRKKKYSETIIVYKAYINDKLCLRWW